MSTTLELPSGSATTSGTSSAAQQSTSSSSSCSSSPTIKIEQIIKTHEPSTSLPTKYVQLKHNKDNKNTNIGTIVTEECVNGLIMNNSVINFTTNDINNAHIFKLKNNEHLKQEGGNSDTKTYCITGTSDQLQKHQQVIQSSGTKLNINNFAILQKSSNNLSQQQQHNYNQQQTINIINKNNGGGVTFANAFITKAGVAASGKILNIPIKTTGLIQHHQIITKQNTKLSGGNIIQKLGVPRNTLVRLATSQQQSSNIVNQQNANIIMTRAPTANINQQLSQQPQKHILPRQFSSTGAPLGTVGLVPAASSATDYKQNINSAINKNTQKTGTTPVIPAVKLQHNTSGNSSNSGIIQKSSNIGNIKTLMPQQISSGNKVTSVKTLNSNTSTSQQPNQQQVTIVGSNKILKPYTSASIAQNSTNNTTQVQYQQSKNATNQTINNNNASLNANKTNNINMKIQQQPRTNINLQVNNLIRQNSVQKVNSNKQNKFIVQSSGSQQSPIATHILPLSPNSSTNSNINNNSNSTALINGPMQYKLTQSSTLVQQPHHIIDANAPCGSTIKYVNAQGNIIQTQPNKLRTNYQQSVTTNSTNILVSGNNNYTVTNVNNPQVINIAITAKQSSQTNHSYSEIQPDYQISNNLTNTAAHTINVSKNENIVASSNNNNNNQDDLMIVNGTAMSDEMSARILQSLSQKSVFNNRSNYAQSHQQQHHNYSIINDKIITESSSQFPMESSINNLQQSSPGAVLNIKNSADSGHKMIPDYFRVNSSEVQSMSVASVDNSPLHKTATLEHSLLQQQLHQQNHGSSPILSILHNLRDENSGGTTTSGTATSVNSDQDDDIIGIEVRPAPMTISDGKLQLLQAVLQDHTYVAPMPPANRIANEQAVNSSNNNININNSSNNDNTNSNVNNNTNANICNNTTNYSHFNQHIIANCNNNNTIININTNTTPSQLTTANLPYNLHSSNNDDDANSVISTGSRCGIGNEFDNDLGEETETAPEGEGEDDSVTRCICDLVHDDGYMICCDKCSAWQHVDCMGIDRQNIPDEYKCEICEPRQVDKMRARQLQLMKRKEQQQQLPSINNNTTNNNLQTSGILSDGSSNNINSKQIDRTISRNSSMSSLSSSINSGKKSKSTLIKRKNDIQGKSSYSSNLIQKRTKRGANNNNNNNCNNNNNMIGPDGKILLTKSGKPRRESKKSIKRKLKNHTGTNNRININNNSNNIEQSNQIVSNDITNNSLPTSTIVPLDNKHTSNLRQWIENYEKAVTNHYSPELRARLQSIIKQQNLQSQQIPSSNINSNLLTNNVSIDQMCTIVPHAGGKILISTKDIEPNKPIVEIRGKYMLSNQYKQQLLQSQSANSINNNCNNSGRNNHLNSNIFSNQLQQQPLLNNNNQILRNNPGPFIFFYLLNNDGTEICVDTRTYGNEARFVRRSCRPNAEIQHSIEKGIIHLYIVSLTNIIGSTEITIKHEPHDLLALQQNANNTYFPTSTICACGLTKDCMFYVNSGSTALKTSPSNNSIVATPISTTRPSKIGSKRSNGHISYDSSTPNINYKRGGKIKQTSRGRSTSSSGCDSNIGMISPISTPQSVSPFSGLTAAYTCLSNVSHIINESNQLRGDLKQQSNVLLSPINLNNNTTNNTSLNESEESTFTTTMDSLAANESTDHEPKKSVIEQDEFKPTQAILEPPLILQPMASPIMSPIKVLTPVKQYHRKTPGKILKQFTEDADLTQPDNILAAPNVDQSSTTENLLTMQQQPQSQTEQQQHCEEMRAHKKLLKEGNKESSSSSSRKLTREERKMEAIVKAFEKMEKNQQRRQELKQHRGPSKRTNSSSMSPKRCKDNDETSSIINNTCLQSSTSLNSNHIHRKKKRKGNKSYPITTHSRKSRRSRLNSGDSDILTSEESTSLLSPPLLSQNNMINQSAPMLEYQELEQRSSSDPLVNTAAGLLLALANPKTSNQCTDDIDRLDKMECKQSLPSNNTIISTSTQPLVSSTCLLVEAAVGPLEHLENNFKLPQKSILIPTTSNSLIGTKTKKTIMNDWLNQSDNNKTINSKKMNIIDLNYPQSNNNIVIKSVPTKAAGKSFDTLVENVAASETGTIKPSGVQLSNSNQNKKATNYHHIQEEPENLSIVAKKVEEFISQNEFIHHHQQIYQQYQSQQSNTDYEDVDNLIENNNEIGDNNYNVNNIPLQWKNPDSVITRLSEQEQNQQQQQSNGMTYQLPATSPSCMSSGSAVKKRWLRQAISEECGDDIPSPPNGCMTPPKKRRIARQCSDISDINESMHIRPTAINSLIQASMASPLSNTIIYSTDTSDVKEEFTQSQIDSFSLNSDIPKTNVIASKTEEKCTSSALNIIAMPDTSLNVESVNNDEHSFVNEIKEEENNLNTFNNNVENSDNIDADENKEDIVVKKYFYQCGNADGDIVNYVDTANDIKIDETRKDFIREDIKIDNDTLNVDVKDDCIKDLQNETINDCNNITNNNDQDDDIDIITLPTNEDDTNKILIHNNLVKIEPEDLNATNDVKIDVELDVNEQQLQAEENNNKTKVLINEEKTVISCDDALNGNLIENKLAQIINENIEENFNYANNIICNKPIAKKELCEEVNDEQITFKKQPMEYEKDFSNQHTPINTYNPNLIVIELKNNDEDDDKKQIALDGKNITNDNTDNAVQQPPDIEDVFDKHKYQNQNLNNLSIKEEEVNDTNVNIINSKSDIDEENKAPIEIMVDSDKIKVNEEEPTKIPTTYDESTTTSTIDEIADIQKRLHSFHTENILILKSRNRKIKSAKTSLSSPSEKISSTNNHINSSKSSTITNRNKNKRPVQLNFDLSVSEDQTVSVKLKDELKSEVDQKPPPPQAGRSFSIDDKMKFCGEDRIHLKQQHHDDSNWDKENSCIKFSSFSNVTSPSLSPTTTQQQNLNSLINTPPPPPPPVSPSGSGHQILTVAQLRSAVAAVAAVTNLQHQQQHHPPQTALPSNNFASHYSSIYGKFSGESREYLEAANNCIAGTQNTNINLMFSDYLDNSSANKLIANSTQQSYLRGTIPSANNNANSNSNSYLSTLDPTRIGNEAAVLQQSHHTATYYTGNTNVSTSNVILPINNVPRTAPTVITPIAPIGNTILGKSYSSFAPNNLLPTTPTVNVYQSTNIVSTPTNSINCNATNNNASSNIHPIPIQTHNPRIYTRTASADPRLNPNLNIPEPPPVPKRKLSINEYRKRKQQTTNVDAITTATTATIASSEAVSINSTTMSQCNISSSSSSRASSYCNSMNNSSNSSSPILSSQCNTTAIPTPIKKCKQNKLDDCNDDNHHDDDDNDINSILTAELLTIGKNLPTATSTSIALNHTDDHDLVHFSPAPTLLELQQENLAERLKSYKSLTCLTLQQQQHQRDLDDDYQHLQQQQFNNNNNYVLATDISEAVISDLNLLATTPVSSTSTSPSSARSRSPSSPPPNLSETNQSHINQTTSSH